MRPAWTAAPPINALMPAGQHFRPRKKSAAIPNRLAADFFVLDLCVLRPLR
jgi:hypothetical protein